MKFVALTPTTLAQMKWLGLDTNRSEIPSVSAQSIPQTHAPILVPYIQAPSTRLQELPDPLPMLPNMTCWMKEKEEKKRESTKEAPPIFNLSMKNGGQSKKTKWHMGGGRHYMDQGHAKVAC